MSAPSTDWAERLFGWTPFRAVPEGSGMLIDWCHLHGRRATEPFFYATVAEAMRSPFNLAFQQRTPVEALTALPPGVPIAGFVFHMSRCGSTLITQALAAFESNIVVSEAAPLHGILLAAGGRAGPDAATRWLKALVNAYARPRFSYEARLVVKFMATDTLDIALVRQAFPEVPWVFVTREPAEILASQERMGSVELMPGQVPAARLGLAEEAAATMDDTAYRAHVLAALARAALAAHAGGKGLILDHSELPTALWTKVAPHFALRPDPAAVELMRAVSQRHSKRPAEAFDAAGDPNLAAAARFRRVAEAIVGPPMAALAAMRS